MSSVTAERRVIAEPALSVQSRVSWGAILAGAAVAVAVYFLLTLLGVAVGLSVAGEVQSRTLGTGAAIWAFVALVIALFFGGWVATQCTVGENRTEAVLYGIIVWALTSTLLFWMAATGINLGYQTAMSAQNARAGATAASSGSVTAAQIERAGREARLNDAQIAQLQEDLGAGAGTNADGSPERARDTAQSASWWAFFGTLLSLLAAIGGALVGPYEVVLRRGYSTPARAAI